MSLKIVGKSVQRLDAVEKVTGRARYSEDFFERDMLVGKVLRSPHAHALVKRIDAEQGPGPARGGGGDHRPRTCPRSSSPPPGTPGPWTWPTGTWPTG